VENPEIIRLRIKIFEVLRELLINDCYEALCEKNDMAYEILDVLSKSNLR